MEHPNECRLAQDDQISATALEGRTQIESVDIQFEDDWLQAFFRSLEQSRKAHSRECELVDREVASTLENDFMKDAQAILDGALDERKLDKIQDTTHEMFSEAWSKHYKMMGEARASKLEFAEAETDLNLAYALLGEFTRVYEIHRAGKQPFQGMN